MLSICFQLGETRDSALSYCGAPPLPILPFYEYRNSGYFSPFGGYRHLLRRVYWSVTLKLVYIFFISKTNLVFFTDKVMFSFIHL